MKLFAALAILALVGCAEISAGKSAVATHGAIAADDVRDTAEWTLCKGITIGAWVRAYSASADKAKAWQALCNAGVSNLPTAK